MPRKDSDGDAERRVRKVFRKRGKRSDSHGASSSCSCSTDTSGGDSNCCCCSNPSLSCSSSDSDERFAKYYKLSSDEMELRGVDFPVESKKKRREMTKLLLHTMVMWDDIWRSKESDKEDTTHDEGSSTSSEDDGNAKHQVKRGSKRYANKKDSLKDLAVSKRLRQTLALKQEHGVFFSGKWYGLPIEEIDPFIYDDTFVVLSWRPKGPCLVHRFYKGDSLGLFAPDHPVRTFAFKVVTHRYFTRLLILTIFANCITLALERFDYDEYGRVVESDLDVTIAIIEIVFLAIYTIEMILKIIAKGFLFQKMAYLRNGWNLLDFVVVISNYASYSLQLAVGSSFDLEFEGTNFGFLRIFRVLRIVKTISILPGLRRIVTAILNSSKQLFEVMGLTFFTIMIFSLFGMEFFAGRFRQKCVKIKGVASFEDFVPEVHGVTQGLSSYMTDRLYGMWVENEHNWLYRDKPESEPVPCGNGSTARHCPDGYVCLEVAKSENPNNGWISFDNFYLASLQTLQVMTLDYWERTYEIALSTVGWEGTLYFVVVIFFGGFYLLNLMLAVVTLSHDKEQNILDVNKQNLRLSVPRRLNLTRKMSSFAFEHLNQQRLNLFEGFHERSAKERDELLLRMIKADEFAHPKMTGGQFDTSLQVSNAFYNMLGKVGRYEHSIKRSSEMDLKALTYLNMFRKAIPEDGYYDDVYLFDGQSDAELENEKDPNCIKLKNGKFCNFNMIGFDQTFVVQDMSKFVKRPVKDLDFDLFPPLDKWESLAAWLLVWKNATQPIVEDWKWKDFMIFCIFINTVISCFEHHGQPPWMDILVHVSNDVFTYLFTFELLLKAVAYQERFFEYGWNKFDLWVVAGSIMDNILQQQIGFKALRGLKLLRILKLAQGWDTMKVLLNILFSAIGDMANLVGILFFAIYIFAMFGMQYIGRGYLLKSFNADFYPANYPRWAWQTSIHSFLMVFRVVSGEWVELTWECLEAFRPTEEEYKCFQTFLPMVVLGNFIVLNLFLALLLHIFDADEINSLSKSVKADRRERGDSFRNNVKRMWKSIKGLCSKSGGVPTSQRIKLRLNLKRNKVEPEKSMGSMRSVAELGADIESGSSPPGTGQPATSLSEASAMINETLDLDEGNNPNKDTDEEPKLYHVIIPRHLPKWRLYKVVTKYVEVGDENDDNDVDDDILDVPKRSKQQQDYDLDINSLPNLRFRQVVYRVMLLIRKEKARRILKKYLAIKRREKKMTFLATVPSRASKFSRSRVTVTAEQEQDDIDVYPCFPNSWFRTYWCLLCWLWGSCRIVWLDRSRKRVRYLVNHENFEWVILFLILASSVTLCFDDIHLEDSPRTQEVLFYSGIVFTGLFTIEFLLKIFAYGIYKYFTNAWCLLDFFSIVIGFAAIAAELLNRNGETHAMMAHLGALKTIRTLRCIRPLRTISRWHGMRIVVNSLLQAIPAIFNVFCVCLVFWLVFAIMGVQFFKGRFYKCVNHLGETVDHTIAPNKQVCCQKAYSHKFAWVNSFPNFDSVPDAYLALLFLATFEGWMDVIRSGIDARDVDQQPLRDYDMFAYVFFVMFCLFGGFLTTKLFIGVIIDNFNMLKKKFEGNLYEALMSSNQLKYYSAIRKLGLKSTRVVMPKPKNPTRLAFFEIAISQRSEFFMFIIIVLNMVVMCCDGYGNDILTDTVLESLNAFFIFIYTLEALVKLIGLGTSYFKSGWNVFDIIILAISAIDYAIGDLLSHNFPIPPSVVRLCRILRVGRVMRLMKSAKGIRRLVFALFVSIPALFNIGALLILVMFIYSILGMALFGKAGHGGAFDELINFETFPTAFLLLFRLITVAGWNEVITTLMPLEADCGVEEPADCGGEGQPDCDSINALPTIIFIVTYLIITNFVIVNMYIAIILENFHQAIKEDDFAVTSDDIELFLDKWAVFDGEGSQFIELKYLPPFLDILEPPLRMHYPNQIAITALDIPIYQGGLIQLYDVMRNLIVFVMGNAEAQQMEEIEKIINTRFADDFRPRKILPLVSTTRIWRVQHLAARSIQKKWRRYLRQVNWMPPPPVEVMYTTESKGRQK